MRNDTRCCGVGAVSLLVVGDVNQSRIDTFDSVRHSFVFIEVGSVLCGLRHWFVQGRLD